MHILRVACALLVVAFFALAQEEPSPTAQPLAHFHHLHLNTTDPQAAISFYTAKLPSEKRKFAGVARGLPRAMCVTAAGARPGPPCP